jgi:hypothetical protein
MSAATFFHTVPQHVARNPVARSVAQRKMAFALREFALDLYSLDHGTEQRDKLVAAAQVLAAGLILAPEDSAEFAAMADAQAAIVKRSADGFRWHRDDAGEIDIGMVAAVQVIGKAPALKVQAAFLKVGAA